MGAAYLAGLAAGYWKNKEAVLSNWRMDRGISAENFPEEREKRISGWNRAVTRSYGWASGEEYKI